MNPSQNEISVFRTLLADFEKQLTKANERIANLEQINEVRVKTEDKLRRQVSEIHRDRETHD